MENLLSEANVLRGDLDELVLAEIFVGLFETLLLLQEWMKNWRVGR